MNVRAYNDHEYCKAIKCVECISSLTHHDLSICSVRACIHSAKDFHKWLAKNDFMILKKADEKG